MTGNAQGKVITKIKQEAKNSEKVKKKLQNKYKGGNQ